MVAEVALVDLDGDLAWRSIRIPDSAPDVGIVRLHLEPVSGASVSLVRFPPLWTRPDLGHYPCAEEFVVLDGSLEVSGVRFAVGDYAYLPAYLARVASRSDPGCLVVAWFSGRPLWTRGAPSRPSGHSPTRLAVARAHRPTVDHLPGDAHGGPAPPDTPVASLTELLWPTTRAWCLVPPDGVAPQLAGPVLIRRWADQPPGAGSSQSPVP